MGPDSGRIRPGGHPIHGPLTHFPVALWAVGFGGDLAQIWSRDPFWRPFSSWDIALGLIIGTLTLFTGFYDFIWIPEDKPEAAKVGICHMAAMLSAYCLFGTSLYFQTGRAHPGPFPAVYFSGSGVAVLFMGGWWGGQLVYRYGIGYDPKKPIPGPEK